LFVEQVEGEMVQCVFVNAWSKAVECKSFPLLEFLLFEGGAAALTAYAQNPLMLLSDSALPWRPHLGGKVLQIAPDVFVFDILAAEKVAQIRSSLHTHAVEIVGSDYFEYPPLSHELSSYFRQQTFVSRSAQEVMTSVADFCDELTLLARSAFQDDDLVFWSYFFTRRRPCMPDLNIHVDRGYKYATASVYLNEDFDGGQLYICDDAKGRNLLLIPPRAGRVVLFSGRDQYHTLAPVRSGLRYQFIIFWSRQSLLSKLEPLFQSKSARPLLGEPPTPQLYGSLGLVLRSDLRSFLRRIFRRYDSGSGVMNRGATLRWFVDSSRSRVPPSDNQIAAFCSAYSVDAVSLNVSFEVFERIYVTQAFTSPEETMQELVLLGFRRSSLGESQSLQPVSSGNFNGEGPR